MTTKLRSLVKQLESEIKHELIAQKVNKLPNVVVSNRDLTTRKRRLTQLKNTKEMSEQQRIEVMESEKEIAQCIVDNENLKKCCFTQLTEQMNSRHRRPMCTRTLDPLTLRNMLVFLINEAMDLSKKRLSSERIRRLKKRGKRCLRALPPVSENKEYKRLPEEDITAETQSSCKSCETFS